MVTKNAFLETELEKTEAFVKTSGFKITLIIHQYLSQGLMNEATANYYIERYGLT
jgi:hypothetical protein